jgi:hypothetical protein
MATFFRDLDKVPRGPFRPATRYPRGVLPARTPSSDGSLLSGPGQVGVAPSVAPHLHCPVVTAHGPATSPPPASYGPDIAEVFMPPPEHVASSRRFAYAVIEPPAASPGFILRRALEEQGGNPCVALAASDYGALLVIFSSLEAREDTMGLFPLSFDGHAIRLERPKEGANKFVGGFALFAQVSATGFPIKHWGEAGIRAACRSFGDVCCVDPTCLTELDFSAVRFVVKLAEGGGVPQTLLMRDCHGGSSSEVLLRVVRMWPYDDNQASLPYSHFDNLGGGTACCVHGGANGAAAGRGSRMSDIDEDSVQCSRNRESLTYRSTSKWRLISYRTINRFYRSAIYRLHFL